ncbi:hypothetical protein GEMRC1_010611 [Eukaryota sp. GEM-RC1]
MELNHVVFSEGIILGTDGCTIVTSTFVSKCDSCTLSLTGCDSTFIIQEVLIVQSGTLVFEMGNLLNCVVDVESLLVFQVCNTVVSSWVNIKSNALVEVSGPTFFNNDSLISGDNDSQLRIGHDVIISGDFDFGGCLFVSEGASLKFDSARIKQLVVCQNLGNISLSNSVGSSVLVSTVSVGTLIIDQNSTIEVLDFYHAYNGQLVIDNAFIKSVFIVDSNFIINNVNRITFVSIMSVLNSTLDFCFNNSFVAKSMFISNDSTISSRVFLIDVSLLTSSVSISAHQHCCNTSFCQLSLFLKHVIELEPYLLLITAHDLDFSYHQDQLFMNMYNVVSFDSTMNHVLINFSLDHVDFQDHVMVPICAIELIAFEPSTAGGFTTLLHTILDWLLCLFPLIL